MVSQLGVYPNTPYTGTTSDVLPSSSRYTYSSYLDTPVTDDQFTSNDPLNLASPTPVATATPVATPAAPIQDAVVQPTPAAPPTATPAATPTASYQDAVVQPVPTANAGFHASVHFAVNHPTYVYNQPAPTPYNSQPAPRPAERRTPSPIPTPTPTNFYNDLPKDPPAKKPVHYSNQSNQPDVPNNVPPTPRKNPPQPQKPVAYNNQMPVVYPVTTQYTPVNNQQLDPYAMVPSHVTSSILSPATLQALGNPFIGGVTGGSYIPQQNTPSGGKPKGGDNWTQDLFGGILNNYFDGEQPSMDGINAVAGLQFTAGY